MLNYQIKGDRSAVRCGIRGPTHTNIIKCELIASASAAALCLDYVREILFRECLDEKDMGPIKVIVQDR